jgi:hypothetical protein
VKRYRATIGICTVIFTLSCRPPRGVVKECEPIPAEKLEGLNTVTINGNFAPYEPRKTDDPRLVLPVLKALERGMVNDPESEARERLYSPCNGVVAVGYWHPGGLGRNVIVVNFDVGDFSPPRYRKEFIDAVKAAYKGATDEITFNSKHHEGPGETKSQSNSGRPSNRASIR